jgi:hypothetical protein
MPHDLRHTHDRLDAAIDGLYRLRKPTSAERFTRLGAEYAALFCASRGNPDSQEAQRLCED